MSTLPTCNCLHLPTGFAERIGQAAAIVLAAGMAVGAMAGPPHAAASNENGGRASAQSAPASAPAQSAPPQAASAPRAPQAAGGGGMRMSRSTPDGAIHVRSTESAPVFRQSVGAGSSGRSEPMYRSPGAGSNGRRLTAPGQGRAGGNAYVSRPIIRAPRNGPEIINLPSGVDTAAARLRGRASGAGTESFGRALSNQVSSPSVGIRLQSGIETARAHAAMQMPAFESRVPAAAGSAMRMDAAGAPAREFGTPVASVGTISANARDAATGRGSGGSGGSGSGNGRGRSHGDHHGNWDHGDNHDHGNHNHSHRRPDRGGIGSGFNFGLGYGYPFNTYPTTYGYGVYSYPSTFGYNFGGPWYTDLYPAGTWGYSTPLYAWGYDTNPIYQWDTSQAYSTPLGSDVWAWRDSLSPISTTFITGGSYTVPRFMVGDAGIFGGVQGNVVAPGAATPEATSVSTEQKRADARLLARINPRYDVLPDFGSALEAVAVGDYTASIYAMRRAAGVNPGALMGAGTPVSTSIQTDQGVAQRAQYAKQVFQNPPQRVVSEADAHFMVGALSAMLGDSVAADAELAAAQAAGDISASTELLRRAVRGDNLDPDAVNRP